MTGVSLHTIDKVADLYDRLRLDRRARQRGAFVVEGPTDASVFAQGLGLDERSFFPVEGRNNVLRFADIVRASPLSGVVCVADRDFDDEAVNRADCLHLVFTDNSDLETMLVMSAALPRVLQEWATASKLTRFGGVEPVRTWALQVVGPVSVLRRANAVRGLGLAFDAVDLGEVIERRGLEMRLVGFLDRLARASGGTRVYLEAVLGDTPAPVCAVTGQPLARGRDVIRALEVALTNAIGSLTRQQADGLVVRSLRIAVRPSDLADLPFGERLMEASQGVA